MIWKHTKSIYIAVFLFINIVLLIIILNQNNYDVDSNITSTRHLGSTNIDVHQVPTFKGEKMSIMHGEMYHFQDTEVDNDLNNKTTEVIKYVNDVSFEIGYLKKYMEESVYRGNEYDYDKVMSKDDSIVFTQIIEGKPVFNHHTARVKFTNDEGTKIMEQMYLTNIKESEFSHPENVREPLQIIEELYKEGSISENAKILDAQLGYYVLVVEEDSGQVIMRPKWQFVIKEVNITRTIYIDAISQSEKIIEKE